MSRVAKAPVNYPANIEIIIENENITVKGPKGILAQSINKLVTIRNNSEQHQLEFSPVEESSIGWAQAGTARALINNMVCGVTEGFSKTLELFGVGYRAQVKDNILTLSLGYSHPIDYKLPNNVTVEVPNNTTIILKGLDKQLLGQVASEIRAFRAPEPYKGKGVRYAGEVILLKEAKKK